MIDCRCKISLKRYENILLQFIRLLIKYIIFYTLVMRTTFNLIIIYVHINFNCLPLIIQLYYSNFTALMQDNLFNFLFKNDSYTQVYK